MQNMLSGKRVLITQTSEFMGPAFCEVFAEQGAVVIKSEHELSTPENAGITVHEAGDVDVMVANLSMMAPGTPAAEVEDSEWREVFAALVDPLPRLIKAAVPMMRKWRMCSSAADCFVGQVFPVCGGWVAR